MQVGNIDRKYWQVIPAGNIGRKYDEKYRQEIQKVNTGRAYRQEIRT